MRAITAGGGPSDLGSRVIPDALSSAPDSPDLYIVGKEWIPVLWTLTSALFVGAAVRFGVRLPRDAGPGRMIRGTFVNVFLHDGWPMVLKVVWGGLRRFDRKKVLRGFRTAQAIARRDATLVAETRFYDDLVIPKEAIPTDLGRQLLNSHPNRVTETAGEFRVRGCYLQERGMPIWDYVIDLVRRNGGFSKEVPSWNEATGVLDQLAMHFERLWKLGLHAGDGHLRNFIRVNRAGPGVVLHDFDSLTEVRGWAVKEAPPDVFKEWRSLIVQTKTCYPAVALRLIVEELRVLRAAPLAEYFEATHGRKFTVEYFSRCQAMAGQTL